MRKRKHANFAIFSRVIRMPNKPEQSGKHSPRQNRLLAALPAAEYERLLPELELVPMPLGWTVHEACGPLRYAYFPTTSIVSLLHTLEDGASAETAVTGFDGLVGIPLVLGGDSMPSRAVVQSSGFGYRLGASVLKREFKLNGEFARLLLRSTQALITQVAQTAVCYRFHAIDQRLCRWLLSSLDRLPTNQLTVTQDMMANMLGVRREGVTGAARHLQEAGIISYSRGHITVLDRPKLEDQVCECYAVVKKELDRFWSADLLNSSEIHPVIRHAKGFIPEHAQAFQGLDAAVCAPLSPLRQARPEPGNRASTHAKHTLVSPLAYES